MKNIQNTKLGEILFAHQIHKKAKLYKIVELFTEQFLGRQGCVKGGFKDC